MPVPAWVSGAYAAWKNGGRLSWAELFEHAIVLADAHPCGLSTLMRVRPGLSMPLAARTAEGSAIWMPEGRYIRQGEMVRQPALARTLRALAAAGPEAFYEGEFARQYVTASREHGGHLTLQDLADWKTLAQVKPAAPMGDYCGHQMVTEGGLMVYALHLAQAADLGSLDEVEAVYAQVRIMEEVFHSTSRYSPQTRAEFIDRGYAERQIGRVLDSPIRPVSFNQFWANTEVLAVRDAQGGAAWVVHSINTSSMFGAGILAGGAYAVRVLNRSHATTGDLLQPGLFAHIGLLRDGKPRVVAASPGWGCMHAPLGFVMAVLQRRQDACAAMCAPRFGLPGPMTAGIAPFESGYPPGVFEMLRARNIPYFDCAPSLLTGRLAGIVATDGRVDAVQDIRGDGGSAVTAPPQ